MNKRVEYEKKLQLQLDDFTSEIERLKLRADKNEADAEPWYHKEMENLQIKQKAAKEKFNELKDSSDEAWLDLRKGISTAWDAVSVALKDAAKRF